MDFDFADDAKELRESARKFLASRAGPATARAAMDGADQAALWRSVEDVLGHPPGSVRVFPVGGLTYCPAGKKGSGADLVAAPVRRQP